MGNTVILELSPADAVHILAALAKFSILCQGDKESVDTFRRFGVELSAKISPDQVDELKADQALKELLKEINP